MKFINAPFFAFQIQEVHFCAAGTTDLVFNNQDWQFCKLVEHLDHAFLHGLVLYFNVNIRKRYAALKAIPTVFRTLRSLMFI